VQEQSARLIENAGGRFILALGAEPVAFAGPHRQSLDWFA
jgi:hypothetical protein